MASSGESVLRANQIDRDRLSLWCMYALIFIGFFYPTSWDGRIEGIWIASLLILESMILAIAIALTGYSRLNLAMLFAAAGILLAFSIFSHRQIYAWGALLQYVTPLLLFSLLPPSAESRHVVSKRVQRIFIFINCILLIFGLGIILDFQGAKDLARGLYSAFYPELYEQMIEWFNKPVTVFAAHSIAAFSSFVLLYTNLALFRTIPRWTFPALAFGHVVFLLLLRSVSGFAFLGVAILLILWEMYRRTPIGGGIAFLLVGVTLLYGIQLDDFWDVILSPDKGLLARYGDTGTLLINLEYIRDNPVGSIGLEFRPELFYGDSGIVEYLLRGSLPLLLIMYCSFWLFLKRWIVNSQERFILFTGVLSFELGYTILTYFRTAPLLLLVCLALWAASPSKQEYYRRQ